LKLLFSVPFNANYEKHMAPVTALVASPFVKRIFLSCSQDGQIRLFDVLNHRPLSTFEPGIQEYLMDIEWSPFRPGVFATVSNNGNVYIYDLVQSNKSPVQVLKHPDPGAAARHKGAKSLKFNPK
jgi:WD40 repeat protein